MEHDVFSTYKRDIEIIFMKNILNGGSSKECLDFHKWLFQ